MRWSCPHCGSNLGLADDKIGTGWSFSRCYKCGGFALIRKAEINLIKVDKAPPGERVLLPEASDEPMLSQEAVQKIATLKKNAEDKPAVIPATPRGARSKSAPNQNSASSILNSVNGVSFENHSAMMPPQFQQQQQQNRPNEVPFMSMANFPEPLPESPTVAMIRARAIPAMIGVAGALAVGSGIYLYIQGQALWNKARNSATASAPAENAMRQVSAEIHPDSAPAAAARAPSLYTQPVVDQVHQSAMAPTRPTEEANTAPRTSSQAPITIQVRSKTAKIHSGPGIEYPVVAVANVDTRYTVADWSDRWFKVQTPQGLGWIRNDLVQLVKPGSGETLQSVQ